MSNSETRQSEDSVTITVFHLTASLCLILLSWSLFHWLPGLFILSTLLPYLLVIVLLSWLLSRRILRWCRIRTGRKGQRLHLVLTIILIAAAPLYSHFYARRLASNFVHELELNVRLETQEVRLIEKSYRHITRVYTLLEPVEGVKNRLRSRLQHVYDWSFTDPTTTEDFKATCYSNGWDKGYEIQLDDDGTLQITLEYGYPDHCKLN